MEYRVGNRSSHTNQANLTDAFGPDATYDAVILLNEDDIDVVDVGRASPCAELRKALAPAIAARNYLQHLLGDLTANGLIEFAAGGVIGWTRDDRAYGSVQSVHEADALVPELQPDHAALEHPPAIPA